jgi:hypothetical protein
MFVCCLFVAREDDAKDRDNQRPVGSNQFNEGVHNKKSDVNTRPWGNSRAYALRRLRKDRPVAALVRSGLSFSAALARATGECSILSF